MIQDCLENAEHYYAVNPHFRNAFEFLKTADLISREAYGQRGRVEWEPGKPADACVECC